MEFGVGEEIGYLSWLIGWSFWYHPSRSMIGKYNLRNLFLQRFWWSVFHCRYRGACRLCSWHSGCWRRSCWGSPSRASIRSLAEDRPACGTPISLDRLSRTPHVCWYVSPLEDLKESLIFSDFLQSHCTKTTRTIRALIISFCNC